MPKLNGDPLDQMELLAAEDFLPAEVDLRETARRFGKGIKRRVSPYITAVRHRLKKSLTTRSGSAFATLAVYFAVVKPT